MAVTDRPRLTFGILLATLAIAAAGCGGGEEPASEAEETSPAVTDSPGGAGEVSDDTEGIPAEDLAGTYRSTDDSLQAELVVRVESGQPVIRSIGWVEPPSPRANPQMWKVFDYSEVRGAEYRDFDPVGNATEIGYRNGSYSFLFTSDLHYEGIGDSPDSDIYEEVSFRLMLYGDERPPEPARDLAVNGDGLWSGSLVMEFPGFEGPARSVRVELDEGNISAGSVRDGEVDLRCPYWMHTEHRLELTGLDPSSPSYPTSARQWRVSVRPFKRMTEVTFAGDGTATLEILRDAITRLHTVTLRK